MCCCVRKSSLHWKAATAFASARRCEIAPSIPAAASLEVKSKYSAIHLCCSFSKDFMFYMGGIVSKGPAVVPHGNESIHTSGSAFMLTDSGGRGSRKLATLQSHVHVHRNLWWGKITNKQDTHTLTAICSSHAIKPVCFSLWKAY